MSTVSTALPLEAQCTHRAPLRPESRRRMTVALEITAAIMVVELVGGWLAGSLALLADAGHMLADVGALALSLVVASLAQRPATAERTFGLLRLEILAALVNGAALIAISVGVAVEAYHRFRNPPQIDAGLLLGVAAAGLVANVIGAGVLHHGHEHSLNQRGAYLHILSDALGSAGALAAGAIILGTGWLPADPLISVFIALDEVHDRIASIPGVTSVHDLHVWTVTSGVIAMSGHLVVGNPGDNQRVLEAVQERLRDMGIGHVTVQMERDQTCE